ncbi:hypothetical protein AQUCO_02200339v1 [Aquilegia coerulea]|uniref:Alliinase C-terminal domain-containing protein n=1 Tax=Aquilegia coerulea TaxID=218851 RepID=A0A2G5DE85_AQUCA|nr:hypothetical protein AQUCO_02200339v1 [Aquilegia coerulea]
MAKIHGFNIAIGFLLISVVINFFLVYNHFAYRVANQELSWSKEAALEAEAVASISCSGHGKAYIDGVPFEGVPVCECNSCYGGKDCSQVLPDCPADADSGDPLFLEPFWVQHAASSAVVVAGWHRMSYRFSSNDKSSITVELEKCIRELHAVIGNAKTDGRYMVFGAGSTQLLNAAIYALSPEDSPSPASVVASIPFYPVYKLETEFYNSVQFKWQGEASLWKNRSDTSGTSIEFVTSPNNPDGKFRKPVLTGPSAKTIYDHAYYWPHFSAITSAADEDLMIFTLSKLTGHAGSRLGWALVKDEKVYTRMQMFMSLNTLAQSHDTQLRTLKLLKVVLKERGRKMFEFSYKTMRERWERISKSFSSSKRFSLQKLEPQYCTYFKNVTGPSPAYAWIKCEREEDEECTAVLQTANIIGRGGIVFCGDTRYVRLSLIKRQDDFELLLQRIDAMISKESGAAYM